MILINSKKVYQRVDKDQKRFWRVYQSTTIFYSVDFMYGSIQAKKTPDIWINSADKQKNIMNSPDGVHIIFYSQIYLNSNISETNFKNIINSTIPSFE